MPGDNDPTVLAATSVCTIEHRGDGVVEVQLGTVVLRLPRREFAALAGTMTKAVKALFPRKSTRAPTEIPHLRLVYDAAAEG